MYSFNPLSLSEREPYLFLSSMPELGPRRLWSLLHFFGSPSLILEASKEDLLPIVGKSVAEKMVSHKKNGRTLWEKELEWLARYHVHVLTIYDAPYPNILRNCPDAPNVLYFIGDLNVFKRPSVALIGTRTPNPYGKRMARKLGRDFAEKGVVVVSGLAKGIDTAAHIGALETGQTLAVLGSGFAELYPKENRLLARKMIEKGGVLSPFPPHTPPQKSSFILRNRIITGLAKQGVVLVQANQKSGATQAMEEGKKQGKALFALPGLADSPEFEGNHEWIREGKAELMTHPNQVLFHLPSMIKAVEQAKKLTSEEEWLFKLLPDKEFYLKEIAKNITIPISKLNTLVFGLINKKFIEERPGYRLVKRAGHPN